MLQVTGITKGGDAPHIPEDAILSILCGQARGLW